MDSQITVELSFYSEEHCLPNHEPIIEFLWTTALGIARNP